MAAKGRQLEREGFLNIDDSIGVFRNPEVDILYLVRFQTRTYLLCIGEVIV
jgi:hypothetical protein